MTGELTPPQDVKLVSPAGERIPLELILEGTDARGLAVWTNVHPTPAGFAGGGWTITCGMLPARTTIRISTAGWRPPRRRRLLDRLGVGHMPWWYWAWLLLILVGLIAVPLLSASHG